MERFQIGFLQIIPFFKGLFITKLASKQTDQTQTHWKICKNRRFFLAWGFQGGISGEWEGSYPVKINSWRGGAKFPSQLPVFWFFFKWQSHTREEMKREIFRLLIRPESPGPVSEPRQGNCRLRSQHCNPRRPCVTGHYISIRNYNHQTTSRLLFWAHMLL